MESLTPFTENSVSAISRGNVYLLLSRLFNREVDRGFVDWLLSEEVVSALEPLGVELTGVLSCKAGGNAACDDVERIIDELSEEYASLFILPGGVSPYESVRLTGQLCQEPEWNVRKFYNSCGLVPNEETRLFADHIGVELGFMGFLAGKEYASWNAGDQEEALRRRSVQYEFFSSHLSLWSFDFLKEIEDVSRHGFYREGALLARRFLELEQTELAETAGRLQAVKG